MKLLEILAIFFALESLVLQNLSAQVHIKNEHFLANKNLKSWDEIRNKNLTRQEYDYSCGSAALSTILTYYYGFEKSENDVLDEVLKAKNIDKQKSQINKDKENKDAYFSFSDLALVSQHMGFKAIGMAVDLDTLSSLQMPVIVYVNIRNLEHFSVYKGMDSEFVYLADPSFGNMKISHAKFIEMFYKRADLSNPGKILAILPDSVSVSQNAQFMQKALKSDFQKEIVMHQMLKK